MPLNFLTIPYLDQNTYHPECRHHGGKMEVECTAVSFKNTEWYIGVTLSLLHIIGMGYLFYIVYLVFNS